MSAYEPKIHNGVMIFELEKPIYGSHFGIWDRWLKIAKAKHYKMVVITKFGTSTYASCREWLIGAKMEKRYYKNPDVPMIFYGRDVMPDVKAREARKKAEKLQSKKDENIGMVQVMAKIPDRDLNALRAKLGLRKK